jgi:hypothetical protein
MTSEPKEIGSANHLAARLPEVELAVILCRVIESIEHHPAPLRNAVYELARLKLRKEACLTHSPINLSRLTLALESAIESVETIYSTRHDGLRKPREPLIDQPAAQTAKANHRPKRAALIVERLFRWPGAAPLLRGAIVAIFAALCAVFVQFGSVGRHAPLSSASQPQSAPIASPAIAEIADASSHRRFVDAGAPGVVRGDALSYSHHVAADEPVKPPTPSRCTQTYKVRSERGGEASINIVRC